MVPSVMSSPDPHVAGSLFPADRAEESTLLLWCMCRGMCESECWSEMLTLVYATLGAEG